MVRKGRQWNVEPPTCPPQRRQEYAAQSDNALLGLSCSRTRDKRARLPRYVSRGSGAVHTGIPRRFLRSRLETVGGRLVLQRLHPSMAGISPWESTIRLAGGRSPRALQYSYIVLGYRAPPLPARRIRVGAKRRRSIWARRQVCRNAPSRSPADNDCIGGNVSAGGSRRGTRLRARDAGELRACGRAETGERAGGVDAVRRPPLR